MSSSISYPTPPCGAPSASATAPAPATETLPAPASPRDAADQAGREPRGSYGWGETYAALDLGTNNCRLLVARANRGGFRGIDALSRIVPPRRGADPTGLSSGSPILPTPVATNGCAPHN